MKCIFIACSYATIYLIFVKFKATYDSNHDTFRMEFIVVPVAGLAVLVNHSLTLVEVIRDKTKFICTGLIYQLYLVVLLLLQ